MGNSADFANMVDLVNTLQMQPRIDGPTSIKDIRQAYNKMHTGDQFGKLVLLMIVGIRLRRGDSYCRGCWKT